MKTFYGEGNTLLMRHPIYPRRLSLYPLHTIALSFDGPCPSPEEPRTYLIFPETRIVGLHFAADIIRLASLKFLWWAP